MNRNKLVEFCDTHKDTIHNFFVRAKMHIARVGKDSDHRVYSINLMRDGSVDPHTIDGYNCHHRLTEGRCGSYVVLTAFNHAYFNEKWEGKDTTVVRLWLSWLFNKSPYAKVFVTKDINYALTHGVVCSSFVPANLLVGGLHIYRNIWECARSESIELWGKLVDAGVDKHKAYLMAVNFRKFHRVEDGWYRAGATSDFAVLSTAMSNEDIKSFCDNKPCYTLPNYHVDNNFYAVWQAFITDYNKTGCMTQPFGHAINHLPYAHQHPHGLWYSTTKELVGMLKSISFLI